MLYPILPNCATQPRVTVRNITLRNVYSTSGILPPGIIRCNATNPCRDFTFENVFVTGWFSVFDYGYITENVVGTEINAYPSPGFAKSLEELEDKAYPDWGMEFAEALT